MGKSSDRVRDLLNKLNLSEEQSPTIEQWGSFLAEAEKLLQESRPTSGGYTTLQSILDSPIGRQKIDEEVERQTSSLRERLSTTQVYFDAIPDMLLHTDSNGQILGYKGFKFLKNQPESIMLLGKGLDTLWPEHELHLTTSVQVTLDSKTQTVAQVPAPHSFEMEAETALEVRISPLEDGTALLVVRPIEDDRAKSEEEEIDDPEAETSINREAGTRRLPSNGGSRVSTDELLGLNQALNKIEIIEADANQYYQSVVDHIQSTFQFYHTQILVPTESGEHYILVAASSEVGQSLIAEGYEIPTSEGSIALAIDTKKSYLSDNLEPNWQQIPQLPDAKSQLMLPVVSNGEVLAMIAIYSDQSLEYLSGEITALDGVMGQIAMAAELFSARRDLAETKRQNQRLQQDLTRSGWETYQPEEELKGFWYDQTQAMPIENTQISQDVAAANMPSINMTMTAGELVTHPIEIRGQLIGTLGVQDNPAQPLTAEEMTLVEEISIQISNALDNARLIAQTQKRAAELQAVADLTASTSSILQQEELLKEVADLTQQRFNLYHTNLYLLEEDQRTLRLVAASGTVGEQLVFDGWTIDVFSQSSLSGAVVRSRQGVIVPDVSIDPNFLKNPYLPKTRSELSVPMVVGDEVVGVLSLQSDRPNAFTAEDVQIHQTLATQLAIALTNAKLYEEQLDTAERLIEMDQLKNNFLANMSHELRTPLNSIIGFADVLLEGIDGELNDRMIEDVTLIRDGGRHLRSLIGDILDQAKIEAGMMELSYDNFDVIKMANEVIAQITAMARTKPIDIVLDLDQAPGTIEADRTRVIQILFNLLSNAVKFTDKGEIKVTMLQEMRNSTPFMVAHVKDSGMGISKHDLPLIFEQFRQVGTMQSRKEGGTGLGLPISKNLVELHQGEIWVESELDVGTTFSFAIPLNRPQIEETEEK